MEQTSTFNPADLDDRTLDVTITIAEINLLALTPEARPELQAKLDLMYRELDKRLAERELSAEYRQHVPCILNHIVDC